MEPLRIPHHGWVVVGDGRKALFLRNDGKATAPHLIVVKHADAPDNARTAELGADRPGRVINAIDGRRSSVEQTDYHTAGEEAFAQETAASILALCTEKSVKWLALVAAPRTLSVWRTHLNGKLRDSVSTEVAKDFTNHPIGDLTKALTGLEPGKPAAG